MWKDIKTCPKGGTLKFDVWAKTWDSHTDKFRYQRFTDCYYEPDYDDLYIREPRYFLRGMDSGFKAEYWMDIPKGPEIK